MTEHVPVWSMIFMGVSCVGAFTGPIVLAIWLRKRKGADVWPFPVGCLVMFIFAFVLEQMAHSVILGSGIGIAGADRTLTRAVYGGVMAGLFEETGRLIAFLTVLRGYREKDSNALMYGAGHGGLEAFVLLGISMINNLAWSYLINAGQMDVLTQNVSGDAAARVQETILQLCHVPSGLFLLGLFERICAVALHLALSVFVWFAVKNRRWILFGAAILMHAAVDAVTAEMANLGVPELAIEGILAVMTAAACLAARAVWRKEAARAAEVIPAAEEEKDG